MSDTFRQAGQIEVLKSLDVFDAATHGAHEMRMGSWAARVVSLTPFAQVERHHFAQRLEQIQRVVDGRQAGARLLRDHGRVDLLNAWVRG